MGGGDAGCLCWGAAVSVASKAAAFFLFFFPRDNSLNKLGSMGVANLPADFGAQASAP